MKSVEKAVEIDIRIAGHALGINPALWPTVIDNIDWVLSQPLQFDAGPLRKLTDITAKRLMRRQTMTEQEIWRIPHTTIYRHCDALWPAIYEQCMDVLREIGQYDPQKHAANLQARLQAHIQAQVASV